IIGEVARADLDAAAPPERARMFFAPRLDTIEPVVTLGEDEGQPHNCRPAETPALPIAIGRNVCIQDFGHAHVLQIPDDRRDTVYAFVGCGDCFAHPTSLTQFPFLSENSREMSVLIHRMQEAIAGGERSIRPLDGALGLQPLSSPRQPRTLLL